MTDRNKYANIIPGTMLEPESYVYNPESSDRRVVSVDTFNNSIDFIIESHLPDSEIALELTKRMAESNMDDVKKFCASFIYANLALMQKGVDAQLSVSALYKEHVYGFVIGIGDCHVYRMGRPLKFEIDYGCCIGAGNISVNPGCLLIEPNDRYLITTSGVGVDAEIEEIILDSRTPEEASDRMLKHFEDGADDFAWIIRFF